MYVFSIFLNKNLAAILSQEIFMQTWKFTENVDRLVKKHKPSNTYMTDI